MTILKYNKYNNRRYMQYRRKTFEPVLDVIDEINFDSIVDELILLRKKIYQKQIEDANKKLTLYDRVIFCKFYIWNRELFNLFTCY